MIIKIFPSGPLQTNTMVVGCPETRRCAIVDPSHGSYEAVVEYIADQALEPQIILITHSHWDHVGDAAKLHRKYSIPVAVHGEDAAVLRNPDSSGLRSRKRVEPVKPEKLLADGDVIEVGNLSFKVIHTPGHTPGGVCYYIEDEGVLLSGDTIFKGTIGKLSFSTGQPDRMWPSLKKLAALPGDTRVYPGHHENFLLEEDYWLEDAEEHFNT
ncbi:MAG: MBL fold metallo-hydrolase [Chlamydiota bacterium]